MAVLVAGPLVCSQLRICFTCFIGSPKKKPGLSRAKEESETMPGQYNGLDRNSIRLSKQLTQLNKRPLPLLM